ncbi:MAG: lyase domain protein repeat-containing protein [Bryobacterales bacterium]|nr:lyase domain protein repeat-containing protein [Bryobacterales bacterium]
MWRTICFFCLTPLALLSTGVEIGAWDILKEGMADHNPSKRAQAIRALGSIGATPQVVKMVVGALKDKDVVVRETAAAVLGEMQARRALPNLKEALDDESAEVSFAAARSLWQMGDQSGRDILCQVLMGDRKTGPGMIEGGMRDAKRKLHSPAALAKIGIDQAAGFLGPFSMGVWFAEDFMKDKGASARALSAKLLATDPEPGSTQELELALDDKNSAVRAAAARALGERAVRDEIPTIQPLLLDSNDGVRYMAAAAIIRLSQPAPSAVRQQKKLRPAKIIPAEQHVN